MRLLVFTVAFACASEPTRPPPPDPTPAPAPRAVTSNAGASKLVVATYNVHADRAGNADTLAALEALDVDVLFVQEVGSDWRDLLRQRLGKRYPHVAYHVYRERWGGLAVLSRYPFEGAKLLPPRAGPFPAWTATFDAPVGNVQVLHVHLFPPIRLVRKLGWLRAYADSQKIHVRELEPWIDLLDAQHPALIVGDFNESSDGSGISMLAKLGFAPSLEPTQPTWRWETDYGPLRLQLDHILHRGALELVDAKVIDAGGSDHLPVVVTFAATE